MRYTVHLSVHQSGFTLLELSIVMLILAIIMGGIVSVVSTQNEVQQYKITKQAMKEIKEALYGFAMANGRLPCPADPSIATDSSTDTPGVENWDSVNNGCVDDDGVVPWVVLGIRETDGWGRRFTYKVRDIFADSISNGTVGGGCSETPFLASFALCSSGTFIIESMAGGNTKATDIPLVIVSHGANGYGAYLSDGTQIPILTGNENSLDETENQDIDTRFVSHEPTEDNELTTTQREEFDDIVEWISTPILMNRMVVVGRLP